MGKCMCDENSNCHVNVCRSGDGMEPLERIWATRQVDCLGTKLMGGLVSHGEGDSNRGVCRSISTCVRLSSRKQTEAVETSDIRSAGAGEGRRHACVKHASGHIQVGFYAGRQKRKA